MLILVLLLLVRFFFQSNNRCRCFFIVIIDYDRSLCQTTYLHRLITHCTSGRIFYVFILIIRGLIRYSDFNFKIFNNSNNKNHQLNLL